MAEENNGNDNTEVNEDEEQDPTTVTLHVGTQADELGVGGEGIDVMDMAGGQDYVASSGGGNDIVLGGSGGDVLTSDGDFDVVLGGSGADSIDVRGGGAVVRGGSGNDTISGSNANTDVLLGDEGDDVIRGYGGADVIYGGAGRDMLYGGAGDDWIIGGGDADDMTGGSGADTFVIGTGHGDDTIHDFDTANDRIDLRSLSGDAITWEQLSATISALADDPNTTDVEAGTILNLSDWGGGTITLVDVTATDLTADMFLLPDGEAAAEAPESNNDASQYVIGHTGADDIDAGGGHDAVFGAEGDDTLSGGEGHDWVFGGEGADALSGNAGDDVLIGGEGDDTLSGGTGADWLSGGVGTDTVTGGAGADTFFYSPGHGDDTITDFTNGEDTIDLSLFAGVTSFADLPATQDGTDVKIDLSGHGGGTLTLESVTLGDLDAADFVFYQPVGGGGHDIIEGGVADDTMTGGAGMDDFVFRPGHGDDTITDFTNGDDVIDLTAFTGITAFADLTATQEGANVKIDLSSQGGGTITLENFTLGDLDAEDFLFCEPPPDSMTDGG